MDNTFDILEEYVDEHMDEILDILRKEYLNKLAKAKDVLVGKATYEGIAPIVVGDKEHIWYNTFNKWSWAKFKNGVIKIENDERRV